MARITTGNIYNAEKEMLMEGLSRARLAESLKRLEITYNEVQNTAKVIPHYHENTQLTVVLSGTCCYYVDDKPYIMRKGSWILIPPKILHYNHVFDSAEPVGVINVFTPYLAGRIEQYQDFVNAIKAT